MNRDIETLRSFLTQARDELLADGDIDIQPNRKDPTQVPDEDEQPLTEMQQVIASSRNRRRAQELGLIERALARLESEPEDFGLCEECDEPIPLGRLKIKPWAKYCVQCLKDMEHPHRSTRRRHATDYHE